jgi:hypothetical protein
MVNNAQEPEADDNSPFAKWRWRLGFVGALAASILPFPLEPVVVPGYRRYAAFACLALVLCGISTCIHLICRSTDLTIVERGAAVFLTLLSFVISYVLLVCVIGAYSIVTTGLTGTQ